MPLYVVVSFLFSAFNSFLRQLCRLKNTLSRAMRGLAPTNRGVSHKPRAISASPSIGKRSFSIEKNVMNKEESVHDRLCTGFTRGSDSSPRLRQYTGSSPMSQVYRPGKADILRRRPLSPCCDFRRTMRELLMSAAPLSSLVQLPSL